MLRGAVQDRTARGVLPAGLADQVPLQQRLDHAVAVYAAERVDLRMGDRLLVCDDRGGLQRLPRELRRGGAQDRAPRLGDPGRGPELITPGDRDDLEPPAVDVVMMEVL